MSKQTTERLVPAIFSLLFTLSFYNFTAQRDDKSSEEFVLSQIGLEEFRSSLNAIVNQSQILTKTYQDEIGKWRFKQYDNSTMISVTDSFIPKFENLTNAAQNMTFPKDLKYIHDALVNSLRSETDSYKHFRNYLTSGNKTEDEISTDLLTKALEYEMTYSRFLSTPSQNSSQTVATLLGFGHNLFLINI